MIEDLVIRAKDSEPEAFGELYELFVEKIYHILKHQLSYPKN